jgi:hypothetical protein
MKKTLQINKQQALDILLPEGIDIDLFDFRIITTEHTTILDLLNLLGAVTDFDIEAFSDKITCLDHDVEYVAPECPECKAGIAPHPPKIMFHIRLR